MFTEKSIENLAGSFQEIGSFMQLVQEFTDEKACIKYLEKMRWANGVVSPFDATSKVYHRSDGAYRCKNTGKNFTVRNGTLFESTKTPLHKWFPAIWFILNNKKGVSSIQLAKHIGVTQKTAWFILQRIRKCCISENNEKLKGEVEVDEAFIGGRNKNRHWNKKVKNSQGRSFKDKAPVLGMIERGGRFVGRVVENVANKTLGREIIKNVEFGSILHTDDWYRHYRPLSKLYQHYMVDHSKKQYVMQLGKIKIHTNTVENCWKHLRSSLNTYNHVNRRHLQFYVNEFAFRLNTSKISDSDRFSWFLCNTEYRITYKQLTDK